MKWVVYSSISSESALVSQLSEGLRNWSFGRQSRKASSGLGNEGSPVGDRTLINSCGGRLRLDRSSAASHLFGSLVSKLDRNMCECFPAGSSLLTGHQNGAVRLSETASDQSPVGSCSAPSQQPAAFLPTGSTRPSLRWK